MCVFVRHSVRRLSVDQVVADDAALDKSCTDALSFVRTCEQLRGYNKQVQPNTVGVLRGGGGVRHTAAAADTHAPWECRADALTVTLRTSVVHTHTPDTPDTCLTHPTHTRMHAPTSAVMCLPACACFPSPCPAHTQPQHDPLGAATRQQLLDLALHYATCFRFSPEVMFDGWELLQRLLMAGATPPLGASGGQMWRLMLVACMMIAARQNANEILAAVPTYDVVSLNTGYSAESIVNTEQNVHLVLGNDATAVSALRVCQVLLERLGGQHQEPRQQALLSDDLQAMVYKVCCSSSMFRVQPSSVAQALVYCLRKKRGLVPLWPAALVQLTGIYDPTVGDLGLVMQQLVPLLGLDEAAQQPPAATPATPAAAATPAAPAATGGASVAPAAAGPAASAAGGAAPAGPEGSTAAPAAAAGSKPAASGPESCTAAAPKAVEVTGPAAPAAPAATGGK